MVKFLTFLALLSAQALSHRHPVSAYHKDATALVRVGDADDQYRSFEEICRRAGFQFESHEVVTEDGYILTVYRIPGHTQETSSGVNGSFLTAAQKPAVVLQHGLMDSADAWVMHYSDQAPAFIAARAGYDVWLNNSRGNTYSRRHMWLDPDKDKREFWDFGWEEMGKYDVPAVVDYILSIKERRQKVAWIGHSQGNTEMYYALAEDDTGSLSEKISLFVALGSTTKMSNTDAIAFGEMIKLYRVSQYFLRLFGIVELFSDSFRLPFGTQVCNTLPELCILLYKYTVDEQPELNDLDRFNVWAYGHYPNGMPTRAWSHYCQNVIADRFQVYIEDYSPRNSRSKEIDLSNIKDVPVAIFSGVNDIIATKRDTDWTVDKIGEAVVYYEEIEGGHISFLVGKDMSYFSTDVIQLLDKYHPVVNRSPFLPMAWCRGTDHPFDLWLN